MVISGKKRFFSIVLLIGTASTIHAQDNSSRNDQVWGVGSGLYGSGYSRTGSGGGYLTLFSSAPLGKLPVGVTLDAGFLQMAQASKKDKRDLVISANYLAMFTLPHRAGGRLRPLFPFVTAGYSGFLPEGNGVNYGGGFLWRYKGPEEQDGIRLEYREYYLPGNPGRIPTLRVSHEWNAFPFSWFAPFF